MTIRWFLSQFYEDPQHGSIPVCAAYGGDWYCPTFPEDRANGWALVEMYSNTHQADAARQDPRILVLPFAYDPNPLPQAAIDAYASWGATPGMSLATLLTKLSETEPVFARPFR